MLRKTALTLLFALAAALPAPAAQNAPITEAGKYLDDNVVTAKLRNGVKVTLLDRGYAPTLAMIISFRVGSADESYQTAGMAHLLEHMLFKGTDKIGTTDYAAEKKLLDRIAAVGDTIDRLSLSSPDNVRLPVLKKELASLQEEHKKYIVTSTYDFIYSSNGGINFNASTSRDMTAYYIELPASKLELWAGLESERLRNPVMRGFYLERDTVLEERLMRTDSEGQPKLVEEFLATAFLAHPYRHPTIGWRSNIPHLSIYEVEKFYRAHYIPARMHITIVGKQDTARTLSVLEKHFGGLESRPDPPEVAIREPEQKGERRFTLKFDANPYLLIGWHKPTYPSRYDYVFDVVAGLLSDGKTSRLQKSLVLDKKLCASVAAYNGFPGARYDSLFAVAAAPRAPHTAAEVEKEVYREIDRLRTDLDENELSRVINKMESSMIFGLDSNMGICGALNYHETITGSWRYLVDYLARVKEVRVSDVREAIDRYLTEDNRTVGTLESIRKNGR